MSRRQIISSFAHCGLFLALVFMVLEVEHIGKLWGAKMSHEFLISSYCVLLIAAIPSFFVLTFMSRWAWVLTAVVLFLYSGFAVSEGTEDLREIIRGLFGTSGPMWVLVIRLAFTSFLFVPLAGFLFLAMEDIRELILAKSAGKLDIYRTMWHRRAGSKSDDVTGRRDPNES